MKRWRFAPDTNGDAQAQRALHAALAFVERHARALPEGFVPESPTQRALLAVEVYDAFLDLATGAEAIDIAALAPDAVAALARTVVEKRRAFEAARPKAPPAAKKRPR